MQPEGAAAMERSVEQHPALMLELARFQIPDRPAALDHEVIEWRVPGQDHGGVQHRTELIQHFRQRRLVSEHIKADSMYAISVLVHEHPPRLYRLVEQYIAPRAGAGRLD